MRAHAREAGAATRPRRALLPVKVGPSSSRGAEEWAEQLEGSRPPAAGEVAAADPDSPDLPSLTPRGLQRLLNVGPKWEVRNRERVKGHYRAGVFHRYVRAEVVKAMLSGQVLEEKQKPAPLGLRRRRR